MNSEAELHALLLKLRDVEQRAEMHREREEALEREAGRRCIHDPLGTRRRGAGWLSRLEKKTSPRGASTP